MSLVYEYPLPVFVRRGRATTLALALSGDEATTVASGTFSLLDENGQKVITDLPLTTTGDEPTYAIGAAILDAEEFGTGYLEEWTVVIGGVEHIFERPLWLVRRIPHAMVGDADLTKIQRDILRESPTGSFVPEILEAWDQLLALLIDRGHNVTQIKNLSALRGPCVFGALHNIACVLDTGTSGAGKWATRKKDWGNERDRLLGTLRLDLDAQDDGGVDQVDAAEPGVFLMEMPAGWNRGGTIV